MKNVQLTDILECLPKFIKKDIKERGVLRLNIGSEAWNIIIGDTFEIKKVVDSIRENPTITVIIDSDAFYDLIKLTDKAADVFLKNKVRVTGNLDFGVKLIELFDGLPKVK
jgi:putative sterol carrier protein